MRWMGFCIPAFLAVLSGCSTDRRYTVTHDRVTEAAIAAISEEAYVRPDEIQRTDCEDGKLTILKAPYNNYSKIETKIDSRDAEKKNPELLVNITTNDIALTRHKEWEQRIHEIVRMKLMGRSHGAASKPTSLPPAAKPPVMPPPPAPAPTLKPEAK